jgi:SAM-dependent methyltransferase
VPTADLPPADLLRRQARWLAPARARLLRRVAIARRRSLLDLGAGRGAVTGELVRRCGGRVIALDDAMDGLREEAEPFAGAVRVCGGVMRLPFADGAFDLVFCQCALMWMAPAAAAVGEIWRVLQTGGVLVALEPDYGGMIEHPPAVATRDLWQAALTRAGADPLIGRKLPGLLDASRFDVRVDLPPELLPPEPARFDLLRGLPLTGEEQTALRLIEEEEKAVPGGWARVAYLPFFLVTATKL